MNDPNNPPLARWLSFLLPVGLVAGLAGVAWWYERSQEPSAATQRDSRLLERLLEGPPRQPVSDGVPYQNREKARAVARAYREPCRWRAPQLIFHYSVRQAPGGFMWEVWLEPKGCTGGV